MQLRSGGRSILAARVSRVQKVLGNLGEDAWRTAWMHEKRGYHGRWVLSGWFVRTDDKVKHAWNRTEGTVVGAHEALGKLRVRTADGSEHLWSPEETRLQSEQHPLSVRNHMNRGTGEIKRRDLSNPTHVNDEAEAALHWAVGNHDNLARAIGEPVKRHASAGTGHYLVEGASGRRYITVGRGTYAGLREKGAPHTVAQALESGPSWENHPDRPTLITPQGPISGATRSARVGEVNGQGAYLVQDATGRHHLLHALSTAGAGFGVVDRGPEPITSMPDVFGHQTVRAGDHVHDRLDPTVHGVVTGFSHGGSSGNTPVAHVTLANGETRDMMGVVLGNPENVRGEDGQLLRVGQRIVGGEDNLGGRAIRGQVTGIHFGRGGNSFVTVQPDGGGTSRTIGTHAVRQATLEPAAQEPPTGTPQARQHGRRSQAGEDLPGWNLRVGDRVSHANQGISGEVRGVRTRRGTDLIRVRTDDGRVAQWAPGSTRFADPNHERAGANGAVQARSETAAAAPSTGPLAQPDASGHITALPARPLPGNRDVGYELEWNHAANAGSRYSGGRSSSTHLASTDAVNNALRTNHGEGLGFRGFYHQGGNIPFYKVESDPTVSGGEFVSPILGGGGPFRYGQSHTPQEPLDTSSRQAQERQGQRVRSGQAHVMRHIPTEDGIAHMRTVMGALKDSGSSVGQNTSFHTTFAVHDLRNELGDRGATEAVKRTVQAYDDNFDHIAKFLPEHRRGSSWAAKMSPTSRTSVDQATSLSAINNATGNNHHTAINLGHVASRGTIEFRAFGGSLDPVHAQAWMEAMSALMEASKRGDRMPQMHSPREVAQWLVQHGGLPTDSAKLLTDHAEGSAPRSTYTGPASASEAARMAGQRDPTAPAEPITPGGLEENTFQRAARVQRALSANGYRNGDLMGMSTLRQLGAARVEASRLRAGMAVIVRGRVRIIESVLPSATQPSRTTVTYRLANGRTGTSQFGRYGLVRALGT